MNKKLSKKLAATGIYWMLLPGRVLANHNPAHEGVLTTETSFTEKLLFGEGSVFERIINTLIFLVGAISVLMLIVGAIRYVTSAGDENAVKGAKNTILYAIIGIVIALLAFAIIEFIIGRISPS